MAKVSSSRTLLELLVICVTFVINLSMTPGNSMYN